MTVHILGATFGGFNVSSLEFNLASGVSPGTGSLVFNDTTLNIPTTGTLIMTDNIDVVTLNSIYAVNPRIEQDSINGAQLVVTIYDRRWAWKFGAMVGQYNKQTSSGSPAEDVTLATLIGYILTELGESNTVLINIPTVYPEVNWEFENPGNALDELLRRYGLTISQDTTNNGRFVICPFDETRTLPSGDIEADTVTASNFIRPTNIVLVGERKINQVLFEDLVPVGEDTDGTIKLIDNLSFAPADWGKELLACFSNIADERERELAEKCIYKWYSIDWAVEERTEILPLLNEIADTVTAEGNEEHDKPYVLGVKTIWNGTTFKTLSESRIDSGYTIDKKLGIAKFNEPQITITNSDGPDAGNFELAELDMVAAYEMKLGDRDDFLYYERVVQGGTEPDAIHKDSSIVGYYLDGVLQNVVDLADYADGVLDNLELIYVPQYPIILRYPGIWQYGAYGVIRSVSYSISDSGGTTEIQKNIEVPRLQSEGYKEKLQKRIIDFDLREDGAKGKLQGRRSKAIGTGGYARSDTGSRQSSSPFNLFGRESAFVKHAKNVAGKDIPAKSFAVITGYDATLNMVEIDEPSNGNMSSPVVVPELIPTGGNGIIITGGMRVVTKAPAYTPVVGHVVGAINGAFTTGEVVGGTFRVIKVDGNDIYVEKLSGHDGGGALRIFRVIDYYSGSGIYRCYEQVIDATDWTQAGTYDKLNDIADPHLVYILNLAENNSPWPGGSGALSASDLLVAWQVFDDEGNIRWVGYPPKYAWLHG